MSTNWKLDQQERQRPSETDQKEKSSEPLQPPSNTPKTSETGPVSDKIRQVRERIRQMREQDPLRKHEQEAEERARNRREQQGE